LSSRSLFLYLVVPLTTYSAQSKKLVDASDVAKTPLTF
jgi:hypothetical protein